jgi:hypothetical protein
VSEITFTPRLNNVLKKCERAIGFYAVPVNLINNLRPVKFRGNVTTVMVQNYFFCQNACY